MSRQLLVAATIAASWTMIAPAAASAAGCAHAGAEPGVAGGAAAARAVVCLVDAERAARGLPGLRVDARLRRSAARHARRMADENFFSHVTPEGGRLVERLRMVGWASRKRRWSASESIGWGTEHNAAPAEIVRAWMADPRDRAVLLSRRTEIGVGVASDLPFASDCSGATYALHVGRR